MATLLESFSQMLTPQLVEQLAKTLDVPESDVAPGMNTAGAVVLGATSNRASASTSDADELLADLQQDTSLDGDILQMVEEGREYPILDNLFGVGLTQVEEWIENTTQINIAPFLPIAAPLFMKLLRETIQSQNLDRAGLTARLKTEQAAFAQANPELASEVNAALDLGQDTVERAERHLARFTPEEWETLRQVPTLASYAVMMSALSGPVGLSKEMDALMQAMVEADTTQAPDSLVGLVSRQFYDPEQISELGANPTNALSMARDACLQALAILNEKALPEETLAYKQFVVNVATQVAQASNDGGILGIGGKPISDEEQMTLDLIAAALAYTP